MQTDADRRELAPHGTLLCPMEVHHDDPSLFLGGVIPCHWHEEIELSVVQQGRVEYTLGGGRRVLSAGEGILINVNVPHAYAPLSEGNVELLTVIVHPAFLSGLPGSAVECALLLVEPIPHVGEPEKVLLQRIREEHLPCVLCINKIDTVEKKEALLEVIAAYSAAYDGFDAIIPISARTGDGLDELMRQLSQYAQEGPQLFPDGMTTDQADSQVCAEIVREKMLRCLDKEIPHGTAVEVTKFSEREDTGIIDLDVTIYCEKASHKGIIIGRGGEMLKRISSAARRDIEKFMGTKVYMETWVKVKENWRDNPNFIRSQGYNEE